MVRRNIREIVIDCDGCIWRREEKRVWSPEEWDEGQMGRWMANALGQNPYFSHRKKKKKQMSWLWGQAAAIDVIPP